MAMSVNARKILEYLKSIDGENVTSADVAAACDLGKKQVDGCFTSAFQKKGLGIRVPAEVELEDGSHQKVKFLQLTEAGMALDPDSSDDE